MIVRPCAREDIDRVVELGRRLHAESALAFLPYEVENVRSLVIKIIEHPETYCGLVAEHGEALVGMLGGYLTDYFFCNEKLACDLALFVEPEHRGSSAAARLIQGFRQWAEAGGAREICLGVSTNIGTAGIDRFYRSLGFTPVGGLYKLRL
jgi:GNAT superfamily N-acetyltransferase